jgi:hypothetical protein
MPQRTGWAMAVIVGFRERWFIGLCDRGPPVDLRQDHRDTELVLGIRWSPMGSKHGIAPFRIVGLASFRYPREATGLVEIEVVGVFMVQVEVTHSARQCRRSTITGATEQGSVLEQCAVLEVWNKVIVRSHVDLALFTAEVLPEPIKSCRYVPCNSASRHPTRI